MTRDRWSIVPFGAQYAVGARGRGTFATYEALWTVGDAIDLAVRLAASPLPTRGTALTAQGA